MDEWSYMNKYKDIIEENIFELDPFNERPNTNSTWTTELDAKKEKYSTLSLFTLVWKYLET